MDMYVLGFTFQTSVQHPIFYPKQNCLRANIPCLPLGPTLMDACLKFPHFLSCKRLELPSVRRKFHARGKLDVAEFKTPL